MPFYPWKFQTKDKIKLHPWKFYKIVLHLLEFRAKNQDPWKLYIISFGSLFKIPLLFFIDPGISTICFLIILEIPCPLRILSYQNTKRDKAIIRIDKTQNLFETMRVWVIKCEFLNEISGMSSTRAEFNFLSIQVIESQLCLWISIIFSSNFT